MTTYSPTASSPDANFGPVLAHKPMREDDEMDITPMIDITFLLLIYFLVASSQESSAKVPVPEAQYAKGVAEGEATIFSIKSGGLEMSPVFYGDTTDPEAQISGTKDEQAKKIEDEVRAAVEAGHVHVVIMAEGGVSYREVSRIAGAASRVDGMHLHFGVLKPR